MWEITVRLIKAKLAEKIAELQEQVESAADAAIHSQASTESRYDGYKAEFSRVADNANRFRSAYEIAMLEIGELEKARVANYEKANTGAIIKLKYQDGHEACFFLIHESASGLDVETEQGNICLLSTNAELGKSLIGHSVGDSLGINGRTVTIVEILHKEAS